MDSFGLIKSFGVDNGELDNTSPHQCFVLGYELAFIDNLLKSDGRILQTVNFDNRARIEAACREAGRPFRLTWMEGDSSESWMTLEVPARSNP